MTEKIDEKSVSFRPITESDLELLYEVYRSTRIDEMGIATWPEHQREEFLRSQFKLQHTQYTQYYTKATFEIILYNNQPVGRLYINWGNEDIRIMDIALLKEYRNQGIGSLIFRDLMRKSTELNLPLSLHVEYYNFARDWYKKLGFTEIRENGAYIYMERTPS